ncbi:MAG: glycoside hydrolase family 127 protein [Phycisphaerales bacterium]|nr:MAG: glycoside hydrolase family 127 protein [Phycisphaerales bacterium]
MKRVFVIVVLNAVLGSGLLGATPARDYPIRPVPFTQVQVRDGFWKPRLDTNRDVTVWYNFKKCEETGRIDNFAKAAGLMDGAFQGCPFDDSDVFKVIEGAAYILAMGPNPKLDAYLDDLIAKIVAAQEDDGYLYTARTLQSGHPRAGRDRWLNERGAQTPDQDSHELYNVGHLYEAAVAHFQATGKRTLLDVAIKSADLIAEHWRPGKLDIASGHQEIEIGLIKLYRVTGRAKYLNLAKYLLDCRGRGDYAKSDGHLGPSYYSDHKPVTEQTEAVGHSVRSTYMYSAMADVAAILDDAAYRRAVDALWRSVSVAKLYITGGIGAQRGIEGFGADYELPNNAYNETCAAIGNALWNQRMFLLHGDAQYIDVLERILYNGFLASVSFSGDRFFYPNPLACDGVEKFNQGAMTRQPWFDCSCCPVNIVRFLPSIPGMVYATGPGTIYANLFMTGRARVPLDDQTVTLIQQTEYPWKGRVVIEVRPERPSAFSLAVRIPGWARNAPAPSDLYRYRQRTSASPALEVNGRAMPMRLRKGYVVIERNWEAGDTVTVDLPMPVRCVIAHDKVKTNAGHVAIERGPIVYCAEGVDNRGRVDNLVLPSDPKFEWQVQPDLLNGVVVIEGKCFLRPPSSAHAETGPATEITLVPYYAWNHRRAGPMQVWLPQLAGATP